MAACVAAVWLAASCGSEEGPALTESDVTSIDSEGSGGSVPGDDVGDSGAAPDDTGERDTSGAEDSSDDASAPVDAREVSDTPEPEDAGETDAEPVDGSAAEVSQDADLGDAADAPDLSGRPTFCDDSELSCRAMTPVCEPGLLAAVLDGCWECVDPASCRPVCEGDAWCDVDERCDSCESSDGRPCRRLCVEHGCETELAPECDMVRPDCREGGVAVIRDGCWECIAYASCVEDPVSECEGSGGNCVEGDSCVRGTVPEPSWSCEGAGVCCIGGRPCDDGSDVTCDTDPPTCEASEELALQDGCWTCVNPATCAPWGEPGCAADTECPLGSWCNGCASGSCPGCLDCVAGCTEHSCESDPLDTLTCRCAQPECGMSGVAVIRSGCWVCVDVATCGAIDGGCELDDGRD